MRDIRGRFIRRNDINHYQNELVERLSQIFIGDRVQMEWSSMKDEHNLSIYSPRIDVAVGPFATQERFGHIYDEMLDRIQVQNFIRDLVNYNRINLEAFGDGFVRPVEYDEVIYMNHNARCFMAIEIENFVSRKHLMGGAINASALGRFGIVIPWSDEKLRAFVKLIRYLHYLRYAEKNTFNTSNLFIITKEQMDRAIGRTLINRYMDAIQ
jgi:hypothetical protein